MKQKMIALFNRLAAFLLAPWLGGGSLGQFASRAYLGSTELSSVSNPPVLIAGIIGASPDIHITGGSTMLTFNNFNLASTASTAMPGRCAGGRLWSYFTTDITTAVLGSGYFTDAGPLGMRPFDVIMITACGSSNSTASVLRFAHVTSISTAGAANVSTGINLST